MADDQTALVERPGDGQPRPDAGPDRLGQKNLLDLAVRLALLIASCLCAALGAPAGATTPLTVLAALGVGGAVVRTRRRGALDALLVGVAGLLVALVLLGLVLDLLPAGLTRESWALGAGLVGLFGLAWGFWAGPPAPSRHWPGPRALLRVTPWLIASAAVVVVAVVISVHATNVSNRQPLQVSIVQRSGDSVTVRLSTGRAAGRYELQLAVGGRVVDRYGPLAVAAGRSADQQVTLPDAARVTISVRTSDGAATGRSLIVDTTQAGTSTP